MGLATVLSACSSDSGDDNKKNENGIRTRVVDVIPTSDEGLTFAAGDVLYLADSKAGARGAVSVLDYDASTGTFRGRLTYLNDDDNMTAFVKFASSDKVSVDTASRVMSIDYRNQSGTQEDAARRSYAYAYAVKPSTLITGKTPAIRLGKADAVLRIRREQSTSTTLEIKSYSLYTPLNKAEKLTRTSVTDGMQPVYPLTTVSLFGHVVAGESGRITVSPSSYSSDGYTYMAIPAGIYQTPILETRITDSEKNLNYITGTDIQGDDWTRISGSFSDKTYNVIAVTEIRTGDFICGSSTFRPVAVVFSTEKGSGDGGYSGKAMSVRDVTGRKSWSTRQVLPSSLSSYVTSTPANDNAGYSLAAYLGEAGGEDYPAVCAARTAFDIPQGVKGHWYLPSGADWRAFVHDLGGVSSVNDILREAGGEALQEAKYWTSSVSSMTQPYLMEIALTSVWPTYYSQPLNSQNIVRPAIRY